VVNWFDQSNADMRMTRNIYLATLQSETLSPFAKESDEEKGEEEKDENEEDAAEVKAKKKKKGEDDDDEPEEEIKPVKIDLEGIQNRIIDIPVDAGDLSGLGSAKEGIGQGEPGDLPAEK